MNERIRELAEQAGMTDDKFGMFFAKDKHDEDGVDLEKFAKLIAKECAWLAMNQHISTSPDDYDDMEPYEQGRDDTASTISGLIRRIFGVEE